MNDRTHIRELTWTCKTRLVSISAFDKYLALFCHNWCLEILINKTQMRKCSWGYSGVPVPSEQSTTPAVVNLISQLILPCEEN